MSAKREEAERYVLGLLVEEMAEVQKLAGKALRFGMDTQGHKGADGEVDGQTPRTMLPEELGDVLAAIEFAFRHKLIDRDATMDRKTHKLTKLLNPKSLDNLGRQLAPTPPRGEP